MPKTVLFVCLHGAGKSRMAAALFNAIAPEDWQATSAGTEPQAIISVHPARLLAGTEAENFVDQALPRSIQAVAVEPAQIVAIDCTLSGAEHWQLEHSQFDEQMRDEIQGRVMALVNKLA
ncbi:MAG TPA: hypothetical protein VH186_03880 [Chloroflexia bacterium]|nr:hypothetical protein [Chloroflexia bacterium]